MRKLVLLCSLAALLALPACHVGRFFIYNFADLHDNRKFPARPVARGTTPPAFRFAPAGPRTVRLPREVVLKGRKYDFEGLLKATGTVAFLLIRHDTLLVETYREGYTAASAVPSFSVAKSYVSALVGIAVAEGHIKSLDEPITTYLPELRRPEFDRITLRHLLQMRSGIAFNESYFNPFGDVAKYYYGRNLPKYIRQLKVKEAPNQHFEYVSVNPQLLGMAVARATGRPLAQYLQEKLWQPMGMEYDASWSLDSRQHSTEKSFCCLNACARDFARFGRLYLHHGEWQGQQLIPRAWVEESAYSTAGKAANGYLYGYQWWHTRRYEAMTDTTRHGEFQEVPVSSVHFTGPVPPRLAVRPRADFFAQGILGQYVYVSPANNLILVRLGRKETFDWTALGVALTERR